MPVRPPPFEFFVAAWHHWQPAILALGVALLIRLVARAAHKPGFAAQAVPLAAFAAWVGMAGLDLAWRESVLQRLPVIALLLSAVAAAAVSAPKLGQALPVVVAVAGAWWLGNVPRTRPDLVRDLPELVIVSCATGLLIFRLRVAPVWMLVGSAVSLAVSLVLLGAPAEWQFATMAVATACLGLLGRAHGDGTGPGEIGAAGAIALVAAATDVAAGKLRGGGIVPVDVGCAAPLFTAVLATVLGRTDPLLGSVLGCLISIGACWAIGLALVH